MNASSRETAPDLDEESIGSAVAKYLKEVERWDKGALDSKTAAKWLCTLAWYSRFSLQHSTSIAQAVLRIVRVSDPRLCTETDVTPAACGALTSVLAQIMHEAKNNEIGTLATFILGGLLDGSRESGNRRGLRLAVRYLDLTLRQFQQREHGGFWTNEDALCFALSRLCRSCAGLVGAVGIDCITRLVSEFSVSSIRLNEFVWMLVEVWTACRYSNMGLLPLMVFLSGLERPSFGCAMETLSLDLKATLYMECQRRDRSIHWPVTRDLAERIFVDLGNEDVIMAGRSSSLRRLRADILESNHYAHIDWNLGHLDG